MKAHTFFFPFFWISHLNSRFFKIAVRTLFIFSHIRAIILLVRLDICTSMDFMVRPESLFSFNAHLR